MKKNREIRSAEAISDFWDAGTSILVCAMEECRRRKRVGHWSITRSMELCLRLSRRSDITNDQRDNARLLRGKWILMTEERTIEYDKYAISLLSPHK